MFVTVSDNEGMTAIHSHRDVFDVWRTAELAKALEIKRSRVEMWRARGYIPPRYWPRLCDITEQSHGIVITCRQLAEMTAPQQKSEVA